MKPKLRPAALLAAFDKSSRREKLMVALVAVCLPAYLIHLLLLGPALSRNQQLEKQVAQAQAETTRIVAQVAAMESETRRQDGAKKGRIEALTRDLTTQDRRFQQIEARMVAPRQMPDLLQSLLRKRSGLQLVSLTTLPTEPARGNVSAKAPATVPKAETLPVIPPGGDPALATLAAMQTAGAAKPAPKEAPMPGDDLFLHGVELKVEGGYGDLLALLSDLEQMPQKMLWAGLKLKVQEYPRTILILKLQTLSREKTWLQL
ncbi:MAG: type II secretion system protein GspM [Rhodocyclaceae bacterium]|nr:type II secretion system protein GspM [Rhodocyclaceae bacterium]